MMRGRSVHGILLEPKSGEDGNNAIIIEFRVHNPKREKTLEDTVRVAFGQIEYGMRYCAAGERNPCRANPKVGIRFSWERGGDWGSG